MQVSWNLYILLKHRRVCVVTEEWAVAKTSAGAANAHSSLPCGHSHTFRLPRGHSHTFRLPRGHSHTFRMPCGHSHTFSRRLLKSTMDMATARAVKYEAALNAFPIKSMICRWLNSWRLGIKHGSRPWMRIVSGASNHHRCRFQGTRSTAITGRRASTA